MRPCSIPTSSALLGRDREALSYNDLIPMSPLPRRAGSCYWIVTMLYLAACSGDRVTSPSARDAQRRVTPQVLVLGDSLAVSPSTSDNFAVALQQRLIDAGNRWSVANASVSGAVTADGVRRVDAAIGADTRILVLALGANDGLRGVPVTTIEQNLTTIVERAQARSVRVLLCGMETPPTHGFDYSIDYHRIFPRLATRYELSLVPFVLAGVVLDSAMNGPDGIHPNSAGAKRIAETVWPYLERMVVESGRLTANPSETGRYASSALVNHLDHAEAELARGRIGKHWATREE